MVSPPSPSLESSANVAGESISFLFSHITGQSYEDDN